MSQKIYDYYRELSNYPPLTKKSVSDKYIAFLDEYELEQAKKKYKKYIEEARIYWLRSHKNPVTAFFLYFRDNEDAEEEDYFSPRD